MRFQEIEGITPNCYYDVKDQLKNHIYSRMRACFKEGNALRDSIKTVEQLNSRKNFIREKFIHGLGGIPEEKAPLNPQVTGVIACDGYKVEKVIFESRPNGYVTANLYIPDEITSPRGAVLFLCGHNERAKHSDEYQVVCQYLVQAGLIVLVQDPIGQGERFSYYNTKTQKSTIEWGISEHSYAGCQSWLIGDSAARYFLHDAMRGIDYLCTRPEVDAEKIGVTGNSGGGMQTCMLMLADSRIAAAAPGTFLTSMETYMEAGGGQDAEQIWPGLVSYGFEHEDILLAMAPKPVLILAVKYDFFPVEGTRESFERAKRFWELYGKSECIGLFEDESTHKYTRNLAKKAAEFFAVHLLGKEYPQVFPQNIEKRIKPIEHVLLLCTKSGQVLGDMEEVALIHTENVRRFESMMREYKKVSAGERKDRALTWLRERVFYRRTPTQLNPRHYYAAAVEELNLEGCFWWSQEGLFNHAFLFKDSTCGDEKLPVTIAVWNGGTHEIRYHIDWIRENCLSGRAVLVLDVSGVGALQQNSVSDMFSYFDFHGTIYKFTTDLISMNDSLAALRTYDVLRTLDMIELWSGLDSTDIALYAHGTYGIYALLAAVLDSRIKHMEIREGIKCLKDIVRAQYYNSNDIASIIIPGILRYLDINELEDWKPRLDL